MDSALDQTNCDKEPVAFINQVQSFGAILVLDKHLNIVQVSSNIAAWLGVEPDKIVGLPISDFFAARQIDTITSFAASTASRSLVPIGLIEKVGQRKANAIAHMSEGFIVLELEAFNDLSSDEDADLSSPVLKESIESLSRCENIKDFAEALANSVKRLSNYERVMIYRFHEDWHGEVIAESRDPQADSYMGNHFPASDIPEPARKLFAASWTRMIADVQAQPVNLVPTFPAGLQRPINLTLSSLRQPSPIHIEYLKNMGVGSSLTISIKFNDRLWGLVACHHSSAKYLSYWMRSTCEIVGKFASEQLVEIVRNEALKLTENLSELAGQVLESAETRNMAKVCVESSKLFSASRVLFVSESGKIDGNSQGLPKEVVEHLVSWLKERKRTSLFFTNRLPEHLTEFADLRECAGLIAVRLQRGFLLIFRPEYSQVLTWGGNPEKAVSLSQGGEKLHPRASFAAWKQDVKGQSKRWSDAEVMAAQSFASLLDVTSPIRDDLTEPEKLTPEIKNSISKSLKLIDELEDQDFVSPALTGKLTKIKARFSEILEFLSA